MRSLGRVVGLALVLTPTVACQKEGAPSSRTEPQLGDIELDEEFEVEVDGRWWEVHSFTDPQTDQWCYTVMYRFSQDYQAGLACFERSSLPASPAKGQLQYAFVADRARVMRLVNEPLGITCLSFRGDLDCHRTAVPGETKTSEAH